MEIEMYTVTLSQHSKERILTRLNGLTDEAEVIRAVTRQLPAILGIQAPEVKIVIKTLKVFLYLDDESNGDAVVACVDPRSLRVKTVMLTRQSQLKRMKKV
jgi:hypothetical protein